MFGEPGNPLESQWNWTKYQQKKPKNNEANTCTIKHYLDA